MSDVPVPAHGIELHSTYKGVSERISDYKAMLEDFNEKVIKRKHIELADTLILSINAGVIRMIAQEGECLYKSVSDLVLYATGAAACSTSDLLMVLNSINCSLDNIKKHLNRAYFETWRYIQVVSATGKRKSIVPRPNGNLLTMLSDGGDNQVNWIIDN